MVNNLLISHSYHWVNPWPPSAVFAESKMGDVFGQRVEKIVRNTIRKNDTY